MRSTFLIVLLLMTTMAQFGTVGLVLVRHQQGRRHMEMLRTRKRSEEQGVGLTHLVVFPANQAPFVRIGQHEVRYKGHLYDVVFEDQRSDTLHLWVHWDEQEEAAMEQLAQTYGGMAQATGITAVAPLLKNLPLFYLSIHAVMLRLPLAEGIRHALQRARISVAPFDEVPHPPPQG